MIDTPRMVRGAIASVDAGQARPVIVFQYNPDTLTRTLAARIVAVQGEQPASVRLKGPPEESIKLDVELDAADQPDVDGVPPMSVSAALAGLELLLYPASARVLENEVLLGAGNREIVPAEAPLTLFVWGPRRVLPVRLTGFTITEEAFDAQLNPTRARVGLNLRVVSYYDAGVASLGGAIFMAYQVAREQLARAGAPARLDYGVALPVGGMSNG